MPAKSNSPKKTKRNRVDGRETPGRTKTRNFRLGGLADQRLDEIVEAMGTDASNELRNMIAYRHREIFPHKYAKS